MEDLRHLEFFATNSKEIVEKQVDSYRQQHSYAGTIIGAAALFISFFLSSLVGITLTESCKLPLHKLNLKKGRL